MDTGGPWAPCGHVFSQRTQICSPYMYIKDILGDEFLSKNMNLDEFLSQKSTFRRFFCDFPDFGKTKKDAGRNSEQFAGGIAPRSLFWDLMVKKTLTKKRPLLGGTTATTAAAAEEFPDISHPHPITHRDGISRSGQPLTPILGLWRSFLN